MKSLFSACLAIFFLWHSALSQNQYLIDSLLLQLKTHDAAKLELGKTVLPQFDTTAANILITLSRAYWGNNPVKAMEYATQSLNISEQTGFQKGIANAYNAVGVIHFQKGEYPDALEAYQAASEIRDSIGDERGVASLYNNIGEVYRLQGNYPEALKNHFAALNIREAIDDKLGIARSYNNIGLIYMNQENYSDALKNYTSALELSEVLGERQNIAALYNNIGIIHLKEQRYPEALTNFLASLEISEQSGDKKNMNAAYLNIGNIYNYQRRYTEAYTNYEAALKIAEEIDDKESIATAYNNFGSINFHQGKYKEAIRYFQNALDISEAIGSLEGAKKSYESMALTDSAMGNFKQAFEHYRLYNIYRDSLANSENTRKTLQTQLQYEFDKKAALGQAEQENIQALAQEELQKQKIVRNGFIIGFAVVLLFAGLFFRQRNQIRKEKINSDIEKKRNESLLLNILPAEVARELQNTGSAKARSYTMVTVMFTDFKDFARISEKISAELLVDEIHTCFSAFDEILQKHHIEKIKTIGDAYLCVSGLPVPNYTHAEDMVRAAFEIRNFMLKRKSEKTATGEFAFELRIGIHTGPVVAGIVGVRKYAYDIWGDTVNLAARMEQNSEVGKINVSGITYNLIKDKFVCTPRGKIQAKNKGEIEMFFVNNENQNEN